MDVVRAFGRHHLAAKCPEHRPTVRTVTGWPTETKIHLDQHLGRRRWPAYFMTQGINYIVGHSVDNYNYSLHILTHDEFQPLKGFFGGYPLVVEEPDSVVELRW